MLDAPREGRRITYNVLVPAATVLANVLSYGLFLLAARLLDRATYGETLALLNLVLIATIPAFAIQTVVARRAATLSVGPTLVRASMLVGIGGGLLIAAASPFLVWFLRLDSYVGVLGAAACVPPLAALGIAQGAAQGRRLWGALCIAILLMGGGRVAGGLGGLVIDESSSGALVGTAVGLYICAAIGWPIIRRSLREAPPDPSHTTAHVLGELAHAAHAHGVFLLLSSLDLILARNLLPPDVAGWYAAGNVIFRAALWLPQPVATMLFSAMSDHATHRRSVRVGLGTVGALVGMTIAACYLFGSLIAAIVGGAKFPDLAEEAWIFAVAGGALALIQFCIYAGLAVLRRGRLTLVWACLGAELLAYYMLRGNPTAEALIVTVASILAAAAIAAVTMSLMTRPTPAQPDQSAGANTTVPL